jgi:hypothetical protein
MAAAQREFQAISVGTTSANNAVGQSFRQMVPPITEAKTGLRGLASTFGRGSDFTLAMKTMAGGGALFGFLIMARQIQAAGATAVTAGKQFRSGAMSFEEYRRELRGIIPLIGPLTNGLEDLWKAALGPTAEDRQKATKGMEDVIKGFTDRMAARKDKTGITAELQAIQKEHAAGVKALENSAQGMVRSGTSVADATAWMRAGQKKLEQDTAIAEEQVRAKAAFEAGAEDREKANRLQQEGAAITAEVIRKNQELTLTEEELFRVRAEGSLSDSQIRYLEGINAQNKEIEHQKKLWEEHDKISKEVNAKAEADKLAQKSSWLSYGESIRQATLTPIEEFEEKINKLGGGLRRKVFDWEVYKRGVIEARKELDAASKSAEGASAPAFRAGGQEAARLGYQLSRPMDGLNKTLGMVKQILDQSKIELEAINRNTAAPGEEVTF